VGGVFADDTPEQLPVCSLLSMCRANLVIPAILPLLLALFLPADPLAANLPIN
jgi:hypothetical protein